MNKLITVRQAILIIVSTQLATKFQRMASFFADSCGRDSWIILLTWAVVDVFLIWLAVRIGQLCKGYTLYEVMQKTVGKVFAKTISFLFIIYFLFKALVSSKGMHEFFATNLFDKLPWHYFGILLFLLILLFVTKGIKVIGRSAEFYVYMIVVGLVGIIVLGFSVTDFSNILPILDNNYFKLVFESMKLNIYFGDFLAFFILIGHIKNPKPLRKALPIVYGVVALLIVILLIVYYGIYDYTASSQSHGLADVIQYTLIGVGIGRIDWFLVLFTYIYTIIATAFFIWIVIYMLTQIFEIKHSTLLCKAVVILTYVLEVFIFKNAESIVIFTKTYFFYFVAFMQIILPFIFLIIALVFNKKYKKEMAT